jgi:tRNA(Ile)-lysidine synthase
MEDAARTARRLRQLLLRVERRMRPLVSPGDKVAVAVSGGADSVALLHMMLECRARLGIALLVAHFNHCWRGEEADTDEQFVAGLAAAHQVRFLVERAAGPVPESNLEAHAREQRLAFFRSLVTGGAAHKVLTAHTLDDQAETVLERLLEGAGTAGLAGIYPQREGWLLRPLLAERRSEVREWAARRGLTWREDATNRDPRFLRSRLRHEVLPELSRYNPALTEGFARLAEIARAEEDYWISRSEELAARLLEAVPGGSRLALGPFRVLSIAEQRRLLRQAVARSGARWGFDHVEQARRLALASQSGRRLVIQGLHVSRELDALLLHTAPRPAPAGSYRYQADVPGVCTIRELGARLRFKLVEGGPDSPRYNQSEADRVVALEALTLPVIVRNWAPGDALETAQGVRKLKRLLLELRVPRLERLLWPVVESGGRLVWTRGFPVARPFRWQGSGTRGVSIVEEEVR